MPKALVIYNPMAGSASGPELWLGLVVHKLCTAGGFHVKTVSTTRQSTPENLLIGLDEPFDIIVAAGGDGTVRMVLHAVAHKFPSTPVGIVPLGTGNLLARNLKIFEESLLTDPVEKAINVILRGSAQSIDMGIMNGQYFAAAAGCGPLSDAIVTPHRRDKENWKMLAYAGSMVQTLAQPPVLFRIKADGDEFKIAASGIFITNIADLGVGMLSETASMQDGLLDMCILSPREFSDYLNYGFHFAAPANAITGGKAPYYVRKVKSVHIDVVRRLRPLSLIETGLSRLKQRLTGRSEAEVPSNRAIAMIDGDAWGTTPMQVDVAPLAVKLICLPEK